jgi:WD40 repeat protein
VRLHLSNGKEVAVLAEHESPVKCLAFSGDDRVLAAGDARGVVRLWDSDLGKPIQLLSRLVGELVELCLSADGSLVAAAATDNSVTLWEASTGRKVARLRGHTWPAHALAFSPDGKLLATGSGTTARWTRPRASRLTARRFPPAVAFAPDGDVPDRVRQGRRVLTSKDGRGWLTDRPRGGSRTRQDGGPHCDPGALGPVWPASLELSVGPR